MKCSYCNDPIYNFQKHKIRPDKEGKKRYYHEGCYEIILDEIIDRVKKSNQTLEPTSKDSGNPEIPGQLDICKICAAKKLFDESLK